MSSRTGIFNRDHPHYKWVALSNTTLGMLMATINSSIVIISLPAIFTGIKLNPLQPSNVSYLLWILMGYMLITAVLVVTFGRMGDMYGRVRIYNLGFVIFTIASIALALDPFMSGAGAMWLIAWRFVQGVGGAMLFANSTAILTDAFPADKRGFALGLNQVAAIAGSFIGLIVGGVLAAIDWRAVFFVSVPLGIIGTIWSFKSLHEVGTGSPGRIDWLGNVTFGVGLIALLTGITYGIQPYGTSSTGWGNPWVIGSIVGGIAFLVAFVLIELRLREPMFDMRLFRIRAFASGIFSGLLAAIGRGGMQFMLIIWLQGIWLPLHGYSFESTPLWAGIFMLPLSVGVVIAGPLSGWLSDRYGARMFATGGMLITTLSFVLLEILPTNFDYWSFGLVVLLCGLGSGLFASPNRAAVMNSLPAESRGSGSGMNTTFQNSAQVLSIGVFFTLMILGLSATLPGAVASGLQAHGVDAATATNISHLPPVSILFAAFLGYNPIQHLVSPSVLAGLPSGASAQLTSQSYFPSLISA
ncbi:MAG TPA: MFS transporter, partial [Microbacteriaceae bacterium]|nr:MFS transporter [Microbacteriaceae bacterium]